MNLSAAFGLGDGMGRLAGLSRGKLSKVNKALLSTVLSLSTRRVIVIRFDNYFAVKPY